MTSPLRRRLERVYPGQDNNSINTYRILSHSNENKIDEYDEIHEPETQHDRAAQRQPLSERPQNLINLPRHGRKLSDVLGSSNTAAGQNTRRSVRLAASVTKPTPAQPLHQAEAVREEEEEEEEEEEDQIVVVPRKRMRDVRKIVLDSDDEEDGEYKNVDGGVPPPIRAGRPPKRLRRRPKAVVSDSEGDTASFTLGPSTARRDESPGRLVSPSTARGPRRSNRVAKPSRSYIDREDADAEDDHNKTLDPQDVTIFEDDPYAEVQTDEEEHESDLEMEEQRIDQGHHTRSKRSYDTDTFAHLHLGSTSISFCLQDTSTQRRSLWASRLYACLKSYQDQCRDTFQRLGNYEEAMEVLSNQRTGPLARSVASVLLKPNLDVEKVVQQELLPTFWVWKPSQWRRFFNYHDFLMKIYTPQAPI
jgi:hypothetical protein